MSKILVAYFSVSGNTKKAAHTFASATNGELFEIVPLHPYTREDTDRYSTRSRCFVEMRNKAFRPEIAPYAAVHNISQYETLILGFPIWWRTAPRIINSFLESYPLHDKNILLFATSGLNGMGNTLSHLQASAPDSNYLGVKRVSADISKTQAKKWLESMEIL